MFNYLVLEDESVASFVTLVGQEKYYLFLICSQETHLHCQEKFRESQEKIFGRMRMNPATRVVSHEQSSYML